MYRSSKAFVFDILTRPQLSLSLSLSLSLFLSLFLFPSLPLSRNGRENKIPAKGFRQCTSRIAAFGLAAPDCKVESVSA